MLSDRGGIDIIAKAMDCIGLKEGIGPDNVIQGLLFERGKMHDDIIAKVMDCIGLKAGMGQRNVV